MKIHVFLLHLALFLCVCNLAGCKVVRMLFVEEELLEDSQLVGIWTRCESCNQICRVPAEQYRPFFPSKGKERENHSPAVPPKIEQVPEEHRPYLSPPRKVKKNVWEEEVVVYHMPMKSHRLLLQQGEVEIGRASCRERG